MIKKIWSDKKTVQLKEGFHDPGNVIFLTQPSTSGTNVVPIRLAAQLSERFETDYIIGDNYFLVRHPKQSKHISRLERPFNQRQFTSENVDELKDQIGIKEVVVVEDILTSGGSVAGFCRHLSEENIRVCSIVALMGDRRLNIDQKTFDRLDQALNDKNIPVKAHELCHLTRSEAGGVIMSINNVRSENAINKITEKLRGISNSGLAKGVGGDQVKGWDESPRRKDIGNAEIAERVQAWPVSNPEITPTEGRIDMETRSKELNRFKTEIHLSEYAASKGYVIDRQQSYSNIVVMRSSDDKINVSRGEDGHWVYYSWHQHRGGSIIDFVQNTDMMNLGQVRQELRSWIGETGIRPKVPETSYQKVVEPTTKDREKAQAEYQNLDVAVRHPYLEKVRCIDRRILKDIRFKGKVFKDSYGNACFPHVDKQGLSGIEMKNKGFTGFTKHGEKAVWLSNCYKGDDRLVICESAIDALSYHQLKGTDNTRYASIGGNPSPAQYDLVKSMFEKASPGMKLIVSVDNDKAGEKYFEKISEIAHSVGRGKDVIKNIPEKHKDWNEELTKMAMNKAQQQVMVR